MKNPIRALAAALLATGCLVSSAYANVIIGGTRVIFPAQNGEVTVRLTNQNPTPALVEAWIDSGDAKSTPDKVNTPFLITPPLFRMEPNRDQSLRILFTHSEQPLPTDRETVFWLNVLEVPPKPSGPQFQDKNYIQLAIRSRLKLFYRPAGLAGDPLKAPSQLSFKVSADAGTVALVVHNPTPYYVTIGQISVDVGGVAHKAETGMVAPLSNLRLAIKDLKQAPAAGSAVKYDCIDDYGADSVLKGTVSP
ncbi:MAG TPA: fimbria/pilus periplasmic chaperone [Dyella sp.]|uniref:fimbrial biogenesis chaperone n=1 Tax=Dyella sp. TaxID=1869338 RepID=UPI002CAEB892|nr:fimbria/pilus periplasmic chaperone [Dyella sp.]HTV84928.1 fimbria/pilus periplasmic chaperone [Dyella sp.]